MGDEMMDDYKDMGALDGYDAAGLDERDYGGMDYEARQAADRDLDVRDEKEGRRRGRGRDAAMSETGGEC